MRDDKHTQGAPTGPEGFALAATVMALVLIGALVTGGFYVASQEGQITRSVRHGAEALHIAEHGLNHVVGTWRLQDFEAVPDDAFGVDTVRMEIGGREVGVAGILVRRLSDRTYFVVSNGRTSQRGALGGGQRSVAMVVRTSQFDIASDQALKILGKLDVGGNSKVSGYDSIPEGWDPDDCPPLEDKPGVTARDTTNVNYNKKDAITGEPHMVEDPDMDADAFTNFGDWDYDGLTQQADKVVTPEMSPVNWTAPTTRPDGSCDTSDPMNWGAPEDPDHPCHDYFPVIHATGDELKLNANTSGQGILVVDGDLHITGGFQFTGIVVVRGQLINGGGGSKIYGTTLVFTDGDLDDGSVMTGNPLINYSSCAVDRAIRNNMQLTRAVPIVERSWFDLSAVGVTVEDS